MKILISIFAVLTAMLVRGTNIEWGILDCDPTTSDTVLLSTMRNGLDISFYLSYGVDFFTGDGFIACSRNMDRQGSAADIQTYVSGAWLNSQNGDIVDKESMLWKSKYLINETFGSIYNPSSNMFGEYDVNTSQYLKFIVQDRAEVVDHLNGRGADPSTCYTGWVEYMIDDSGKFNLLNSAIDFDGGPMIVGAIPEPTSGLLLLLGIAGLALRRKSTATQP